jgi:hypothetical protein
MTNVSQTTTEYTEKLRQALQRDTTLRQLAAQATTRYAGEQARIDRGLVLALNGHVTLHADGTASVQSGTDAEVVYTVNGHCDCPDVARAPESRCKHVWAKCLVKRAIKSLAEAEAIANTKHFFATYYPPSGEMVSGIAEHTANGWLFIGDEGQEPQYVAVQALCLGGNVGIANAQQVKDGNRVTAICGY